MFDIAWFLFLTRKNRQTPMTCVHLHLNELHANCLKCHAHTYTTIGTIYCKSQNANSFTVAFDLSGLFGRKSLSDLHAISYAMLWKTSCCKVNFNWEERMIFLHVFRLNVLLEQRKTFLLYFQAFKISSFLFKS